MHNPELDQTQRAALWRCYAYLLQRRAARMTEQRMQQQTADCPDVSEARGQSAAVKTDADAGHPSILGGDSSQSNDGGQSDV